MKRPLCYVCVALVVTVFIYLVFNPLPLINIDDIEGSWVTFQGNVYQKEYKGEKLILYLNQVKVYESTECDFSKKDSQDSLKINKDEKEDVAILCYMNNCKEAKMGSTVLVRGEVQRFSEARNPGGFDAQKYYQIMKLDFQLYSAVLIEESKHYSKYHEWLYQVRRKLEQVYDHVMPESEASIMKAMVLGNKAELDLETKTLFQKSGISHILAISGLHISLIGMGIYKLLKKLRIHRVISIVISIILMVMYGDMVGMSSSAYRAIFMFAMKLSADLFYRTYDMLTAVAIAAVLLLLEQPLYLYHTGFLLSFGAILGIGCFADSFGGSISVFLIHFPIMLNTYYEFPIYSFMLNLLIIPAMGILMMTGILCVLVGSMSGVLVCMGVSQLLAGICILILRIMERLCEISLMLPQASWIIGKPETWKICVFYAVVIVLFIFQEYCKNINKKKLCVDKGMKITISPIVKFGIVISSVILLSNKTYHGLEITFVDVGQGDCIWIETPLGKHYLVDSGSTSRNNIGKYTLIPFLKYTGTDTIDAVFLTHLDTDHTSGIIELLSGIDGMSYQNMGIKIKQIVVAKAVIRDDAYKEIYELCKKNNISLVYASEGDAIVEDKTDRLKLEVLHPSPNYDTDSRNAYSIVLKLDYRNKYGTFGALLTGDVEADGEIAIAHILDEQVRNYNWKCHLYKAAHHGSKYSNTTELLEMVKPMFTVISCGENNSYGHPHAETLQRLEKVDSTVLNTSVCGAVSVKVYKNIKIDVFIQ